MIAHYTPENGSSRVERRRRSGVRAAWIWGGVLLAGLLIYLAAFGIVRHFQHLSWSKAINAALRNNNAEEAAMLLTACRREVPALARQPRFVIWQNKLLEIQQRNAARHIAFERKTAAIKKLIDSQEGETAALETMLLDAAREASTPEEIAQIRELQTLCETLARVRMLEAAQGGVRELQTLSRNLAQLAESRQKNDFTSYRKLMQKSSALVKNLSIKYQAIPEVTAQIQKLRGQFDQEYTAGIRSEERFIAQESAFKDIAGGISAEEITRRGKAFLRKYPVGKRSDEVRNLLEELLLLQAPHKNILQQRLDNMQDKAEKSLQALQSSWQKLMSSVLQDNRHELALYYTGKTNERSPQHLMRFETWEAPEWSQPDSSGMRHLSFNDTSGRRIAISLNSDGRGVLTLPEGKFICRLAWGETGKTLPQAYWQNMLYDLSAIIRQTKAADTPEVLLELNLLINQEKIRLPEELAIKIFDLLLESAKVLEQVPQEFIMQRKLLDLCSKNTPVFAGLARLNAQKKVEFYPGNAAKQSGTLWRPEAQNGARAFKLLGTMQNGKLSVQDPTALKDGKLHVLAVPAAGADYVRVIADHRREAAGKNLKMPDLPEFLRNTAQ